MAAERKGRYFPLARRVPGMSEFTVSGQFRARDGWQEFEKQIEAPNQQVALEHTYSQFGSQHGLKRTQIEVFGVTA